MSKMNEARKFLQDVGMPEKQQSDVCCYVILALARIKQEDSWSNASNEWLKVHDIIQFTNECYGKDYKENSRETFRKTALHHLRTAAIVEDNGKATNSPKFMYRLTNEALDLLKNIKTSQYDICLNQFLERYGSLVEIYRSKKIREKMPVRINEEEYEFSPGKHNELQKAILEEFAPRFAPNSECVYVGDTIEKDMVKNLDKLKQLGFEITLHDKMPDVVLYREDKNWFTLLRQLQYWSSVTGSERSIASKNHYVEEQGEKALKIISAGFEKYNGIPDLFVISPFTSVISEIRESVKNRMKNTKYEKEVEIWCDKNCGTVHKFQGKEASEVIFLLGCDINSLGAVKWVKSNIVNVAVTRAKYRLYVIGDYNVWKNNSSMQMVYKKIMDEMKSGRM